MLERQPGMVSRICESFKGLHLMVAGSFHDARAEDLPLTRMAESDTRPKKFISTYGGPFHPRSHRHPSRTDQRHFATGPATRANRSRAHCERDEQQTKDMATREIVCWSMVTIRAQLMTGKEMGVQSLNLLRQAFWKMSRNPAGPNRNVRGNKWSFSGEFL